MGEGTFERDLARQLEGMDEREERWVNELLP